MIGKKVNGYEFIEFKGSGSFGSVYLCKKESNLYAVKVFNIEYVYTEFSKGADNRITREIGALKIVNHPNVVSYIDEGVFEENGLKYVFVVMDYIDGVDLKKYIEKYTFSVNEAVSIFREIMSGVSAIHEKHIVHRDLKPENIYITSNKAIKILDFGLSKFIDFTSITSTGTQIGSPLYMSPEQIKDSKNIDYRSDYYAAGVILYEMLSKNSPYGRVQSREELFYKIINEPIIGIRQYIPTIPNNLDNLLSALLEKENYRRPNSVDSILKLLESPASEDKSSIEFTPSFFLRTYNEKTAVIEYQQAGFSVENYIFPINHQARQKQLLQNIISSKSTFFIDPATMRLAYDSFSEVKGLTELPYAPKDFSRLELDDLQSLAEKKEYVKKVVDEQLKYNPSYIVAPFHVSNNSNLVRIKATDSENWFSLDVKLLYETKDYLSQTKIDLPLIGGFCIKTDILTAKTEREYFLNVLSGLPCDAYWIYVDCIDFNSNPSQLFHYANTLLWLQKSTQKPVIAGRIGPLGLILLSFGLYGFESGAARFERFDEDLYKNTTDSYNMYVNYYFPELLKNVPVERKNPAKIISLLSHATGRNMKCNCPFCSNKQPAELAEDKLAKKHFLFVRQKEIEAIRNIPTLSDRVEYMRKRVSSAITLFQSLRPIFKPDDYAHLKNWLELIENLKKQWVK